MIDLVGAADVFLCGKKNIEVILLRVGALENVQMPKLIASSRTLICSVPGYIRK